jgi:hypothetical protein
MSEREFSHKRSGKSLARAIAVTMRFAQPHHRCTRIAVIQMAPFPSLAPEWKDFMMVEDRLRKG